MIKNTIIKVLEGSIAEELELEPGDELISVNGNSIQDYIDYKYQISDEEVVLEVKKADGEVWELEIEKEYDEDLGIVFNNPLMDNIKVCSNKCVFCFVDQMPKGMRKTLYLKDDDTRLSFLYGNYITLTNLSDDEINRIIRYRISPVKVSVHTTNTKLRNEMLGNPKSKDILECLKKLTDAGITVDCQIVLCPNINDKEHLDKTIDDLSNLYPQVRSVAVVPVGLTDYREKLYKLDKFDEQSALDVINQVSKKQEILLKKINTRFVFIADEFFVLSKTEFPPYEYYEEFDQIENGIGLYRLLEKEVIDNLKNVDKKDISDDEFAIVTGVAAYDLMVRISKYITDKLGVKLEVIKVLNDHFGHNITVAGLLTGKDIINQLRGRNYKNIIIPKVMVEHENNIFLDDVTIDEVEKELNTNVIISDGSGKNLIEIITKDKIGGK